MKKINSILLILAAAAGFTNCAKTDLVDNKEVGNGGTVVYATTDAATKTTLADDYKVLWSTGDQIKFVKDGATSTTYTFTLDTGSGSSIGTFKCNETPSDGTYTVYYPAAYDGTTWPSQTYVSATDISGALMKATATVSGGSVSDLTFTNEGGILRYTVKGSKTIKSINVKSASPALDVTLDCGTSGVALTAEGTVFNIALPAGTYSNATLTFAATDNTTATKTASSFIVTKNMVSLATFEASALSFVVPAPDGFVGLGVVVNGKPLYWATCNLGASKAEECGDYFAWGETAPYYTPTGGWPSPPGWGVKTNGYAWKTYCGQSDFVEWSTPPYDATSKNLLPAYDAATVKNSNWRMPTKEDFAELFSQCYAEWGSYNSVVGLIVYKAKEGDKGYAYFNSKMNKYSGSGTSWDGDDSKTRPSYSTASDTFVFFPAAGYVEGTFHYQERLIGGYWSSSLITTSTEKAYCLFFYSDMVFPQDDINNRYLGYSVRPVSD